MPSTALAPFKIKIFSAIWLATLLSNLGVQAQAMAAGWLMTELAGTSIMVSAVQGAATLPLMLFAIFAGTLGDLYNKRKIMLVAQSAAFIAALGLAAIAWQGLTTPGLLLLFTFLISVGLAFYAPVWQSSIRLQVGRELVPAAVSLNAAGFNLARGIAPALGGFILAVAGAAAVFTFNALSFIGIIAVLFFWRTAKIQKPAAEPAGTSNLFQQMGLGIRYVSNTPKIRVVLLHVLVFMFAGSLFYVLLPLMTKDILQGDSNLYAMALIALAMGSLVGGLSTSTCRQMFGVNNTVILAQIMVGLGSLGVVLSSNVTVALMFIAVIGAGWLMILPTMNAVVQLLSPDWVVSRAVAIYQTVVFGAYTLGSLFWGQLCEVIGLQNGVYVSVGMIVACIGLLFVYRVPELNDESIQANEDVEESSFFGSLPVEPEVNPQGARIVTVINYRIDKDRESEFLAIMRELRQARTRLGARNWALQRDIDQPNRWVERFVSDDWQEHVNRRSRYSASEERLHKQAAAMDRQQAPEVARYASYD